MKKRSFTMRYLFFLLLFAGYSGVALANYSSLEMFILHQKDETSFVPVSTLWQIDNTSDPAVAAPYVSNAQFLSIDMTQLASFMKAGNKGITVTLPKIGGGVYTVDLAQYNFLNADFKVQTVANGIATDRSYTPGLYYRGVVAGVPNSLACFSFFNDEVYGLFSIPGEGNYVLALDKITSNTSKLRYILFNDKDVKIKIPGGCGEEELEQNKNVNVAGALERNAYNTCREIKVFEKADYATYKTYSRNVTTATNYVTTCFNALSTLYRNEGIYATMKIFQIDTALDAYYGLTSIASNFLIEFGKETQNNLHGADLGQLLSTTNGTMGGIAWLGALCASYDSVNFTGPYTFVNITNGYVALPTYSFDVHGMTHEMGHTLGSPHTHNCSWPGGAIDGCYTLEGNCAMPVPQYPVNGGTIMSYCHLVSGVGVNFANGFGPLPGNLVRNTVATTSCGNIYSVTNALAVTSTTLIANRECTMNGTTYYWNDNNTADTSDDKMVFQVLKNGNDIGTIDSPGFTAQTVTTTGYGSGTGTYTVFPTGSSTSILDTCYTMHRYWKLTTGTTTPPASNIHVMFPFLQTDKSDVFGSLPVRDAGDTAIYMYLAKTVSPNPVLGFTGATAANFIICQKTSALSLSNWTETISGNVHFANFLTAAPSIGGSGFVTYKKYLGIPGMGSVSNALAFYPNPAKDAWTVTVPAALDNASLQLFDAMGRMVHTQLLHSSTSNVISAAGLPAGVYFYRATGVDVYTGDLVKQ